MAALATATSNISLRSPTVLRYTRYPVLLAANHLAIRPATGCSPATGRHRLPTFICCAVFGLTMHILTLDDATLTQIIRALRAGQPPSTTVTCAGPTYLALRHQGQRRQAAWCYALTLADLWEQVWPDGPAPVAPAALPFDALELCFTDRYRRVALADFDRAFANVHRGIRGIEVQYKDQLVRYGPTQMVAANLSFQQVFERFLQQQGLTIHQFAQTGGVIQAFEARQVLVQIQPSVAARTLHRGSSTMALAALSLAEVAQMTTTMGQWLLRQVQADGRLVYKYFPSRGGAATSNNLIRQLMATLCLLRYAAHTQQPAHRVLAACNLAYNLQQFYRQAGDLGWVEHDGKVKLGAVALAALCLLEYAVLETDGGTTGEPSAVLQRSRYGAMFQALCRMVNQLWQPDGAFRTFWQPRDRNDNQNFYPGEALLFWATLYEYNGDPALLACCYQSFAYYRDWHRQQRNPAFIPWHTQAYARLFAATGDRQFLDFIFEMNDWLLPMQQRDTAPYPDLEGRFYDPDHPEYGPPHASSTGVYLEGLAVAADLARQVGESDRATQYEAAIWWGIRSLRQLQFRDAADLFYIARPAAVHGGLRTTVYNNVIRVDNVQHGLMALMTLLQSPSFQQSQPPTPPGSPLAPTAPPAAKMVPASVDATVPQHVFTARDAAGLKEFRLIDPQVNIPPLLAEIAANADLWLRDTSRQDKVKVQRETQTIYLRSAVKPLPPGVTHSNDVQPSQRTQVASRFPQIMGWLADLAQSVGGELGRATLVRLAPCGRVYRHIDQGEYYRLRDRYHLVLYSPAGSLLGAGAEWVRMQPGEFWWFNNKAPHEAYNEADDWRIHLIFDVRHGLAPSPPMGAGVTDALR